MRLTLLFVLCATGCALLGKGDPQLSRYYTPEYDADAKAVPARSDLQLRLGRVEGWSHLRERMAERRSTRELVYREDRRWTERPEVYLRRALSRTLFEERGVVESLAGRGFSLDVELIAFEEIEQPHRARMQALLVLRDDRLGLLEETITIEQPVAKGEEGPAVADAFSLALHAGVTRIADRVVAKLVAQTLHATK